MKGSKLLNAILIISIIVNFITISYLYILLLPSCDKSDLDKQDVPDEFEEYENTFLKPKEVEINESWNIDIGDFVFGIYNLEMNNYLEIGNVSLYYSGWYHQISVRHIPSNETLASFSYIHNNTVKGVKGFQMRVLSAYYDNVTVECSPYDKTDFYGTGIYQTQRYKCD